MESFIRDSGVIFILLFDTGDFCGSHGCVLEVLEVYVSSCSHNHFFTCLLLSAKGRSGEVCVLALLFLHVMAVGNVAVRLEKLAGTKHCLVIVVGGGDDDSAVKGGVI